MAVPQIVRGNTQRIDQVPLAPIAGSTTATRRFAIRACGPIDLKAGDRVAINAREQLDNENRQAGGGWKEWLLRGATLHREGVVKRDKEGDVKTVPWYWLDAKGEMVNVDPRWTLWVGASLAVWRVTSLEAAEIGQGKQVIRETGENFDNWIHHWRWADQDWDVIDSDAPGSFYVTTLWFETTPEYRLPGQTIEVTPRGSVVAAVFRG